MEILHRILPWQVPCKLHCIIRTTLPGNYHGFDYWKVPEREKKNGLEYGSNKIIV